MCKLQTPLHAACKRRQVQVVKYLVFNNANIDEDCKLVAKEQGIDLNNVIRESIQLSKTLFQKSTTTSFGKTCFPCDILFESSDPPLFNKKKSKWIK